MTEIVPSDSRYVPLTQQKWCCVPTCIQMVMLRHSIPLISAEEIAHYLEITVPVEDRSLFWNIRSGPRPKAGWGTQVFEEEAINNMCAALNIPLLMHWRLIDTMRDFDQFAEYVDAMSMQDDTLICFDQKVLFGEGSHGGHVCVVDIVDMKARQLRIIDPEYDIPKWRLISYQKLYDAMVYHGAEKSAGFWELRKV